MSNRTEFMFDDDIDLQIQEQVTQAAKKNVEDKSGSLRDHTTSATYDDVRARDLANIIKGDETDEDTADNEANFRKLVLGEEDDKSKDLDKDEEKNYLNEDEEDIAEEDEEEDVKNDQNKDQDKEENDDEDDYDLLDVLRDEELLMIPEDFDGELDEETLSYFKEQTKLYHQHQILSAIRQPFNEDPYKAALFDYFIEGNANADIPRFTQYLDNLQSYQNMDTSTEESQRRILSAYFREGLNPNIPAHRSRLDKIEDEVDEAIENLKGDELSEEAKQYFTTKEQSNIAAEQQRVKQMAILEQQFEDEKRKKAAEWHRNFQQSIASKNWTSSKKQAILQEQYGEVAMNDGTSVPVWYAKEMIIKSDPALYQIYLDWLHTGFDLKNGTFKSNITNDLNKEVTSKILKMANKKGIQKRKGYDNNTKTGSKKQSNLQALDPLDNL